jgi:S-adenosylmethionine decarboxylase
MFSDESMTTSGKHLISDIKNIKNNNLLNDISEVTKLFDTICKKYDFQILNKTNHIFEPEGFSIIYLLSESHMSIHTFPEKNYAAIDLYTCRQYNDNHVYNEIYNYFVSKFDAKSEIPIIIDRRF